MSAFPQQRQAPYGEQRALLKAIEEAGGKW
jgi:hypothetical protein